MIDRSCATLTKREAPNIVKWEGRETTSVYPCFVGLECLFCLFIVFAIVDIRLSHHGQPQTIEILYVLHSGFKKLGNTKISTNNTSIIFLEYIY